MREQGERRDGDERGIMTERGKELEGGFGLGRDGVRENREDRGHCSLLRGECEWEKGERGELDELDFPTIIHSINPIPATLKGRCM